MIMIKMKCKFYGKDKLMLKRIQVTAVKKNFKKTLFQAIFVVP